ncbi:MAG: serine/threonine protein kinase [Betaproteobacteria bacterium]|nr:serine/threonine protein kinase [Betaproteobacteria bacterium]
MSPAGVASTLRGIASRSLHTPANEVVPKEERIPTATTAAASRLIPGYRVLRQVGSAGTLYLAQRETDGLAVVIKMPEPALLQDAAFCRRFIEECRTLRRVAHDNIVIVHDEALSERQGYLIMEHCASGDLTTRIGASGLSPDLAMLFLAQIARGLAAAHGAGVIHRNLKPQNILLRNPLHLALADFGPTRTFASDAAIAPHGSAIATPLYMSPEQCIGAEHDVRGDLYSLGAVFFHMLTGRPPYTADNAGDLAFQHVHGPVPRLPARLADHQPLVNRLLAKRPEHRPRSAAALLTEIQQ